MQKKDARKIGILGGSFNPAHEGHRELSLTALTHLGLDEVWWLVTPGNPLKDALEYEDYEKRCAKAFEVADHPRIMINTIEQKNNLTYTIDTLHFLKNKHPHDHFIWLTGADNLGQFHRWRDWKKIFKTIPIAVFNRPGYAHNVEESTAAQHFNHARLKYLDAKSLYQARPPAWMFIPHPENSISSMQIRKNQKKEKTEAITRMALTPKKSKKKLSSMTNPKVRASTETQNTKLKHFLDLDPELGNFRHDLIEGLSKPQKSLSPKYFYDETGSALFEDITQTQDYYPTRTELSLMRNHLPEIQQALGPNPAIFEYGSGASEKIRLLIESLSGLQNYVAMDISRDFLLESANSIATHYPHLNVSAICADFNEIITLPDDFHPDVKQWTGYFPGSTIGNFAPGTVKSFFNRVHDTLTRSSSTTHALQRANFLIGFDLIKEEEILNRAYSDSEGMTAQFNLNLLTRMKTELHAELNVEHFRHHAFYNSAENRIEMHLQALQDTQIRLDTHKFEFSKNETLLTEYSYKYTRETMEEMLLGTPWRMSHYWTDPKGWFGTCLLSNN